MNRIEILTAQAEQYPDEFLLEQLDAATEVEEIRVLDLELERRTSPYFRADSQRSFLADLTNGTRLFS